MGMKDFVGSSRVQNASSTASPTDAVINLHEQAMLILKDRGEDYGDASTFFQQVANAVEAITGQSMSSYQCCLVFLIGKLVRYNQSLDWNQGWPEQRNQKHEKALDNLRDGMNYLGFLDALTK